MAAANAQPSLDSLPDYAADLVTCSVCMEYYEDPKLLHCGHTFCETCIEQFCQAIDITCPVCRKVTVGGPQDLQTDFRVSQIREALDEMSRARYSTPSDCDFCLANRKQSKSELTCLQCKKTLCRACVQLHQSNVDLRKHIMVKPDQGDPTVSCRKHTGSCTHLCPTCQKLVCVTCMLTTCIPKLHRCIEISEAVKEARPHIQWLSRNIEGRLEDITSCLQAHDAELTTMAQIYDELETEIKAHTATLIADIERNSDALLVKVQKSRSDCLKQIKQSRRHCSKKQSVVSAIADCPAGEISAVPQPSLVAALPDIMSVCRNYHMSTIPPTRPLYLEPRQDPSVGSLERKQGTERPIAHIREYGDIPRPPRADRGALMTRAQPNRPTKTTPSANGVYTTQREKIIFGFEEAWASVFVSESKLAVSDNVQKKVFLCDLTDDVQKSDITFTPSVSLADPYGICYQPYLDILACADGGGLVYLNPDNLDMYIRLKLPRIKYPKGLGLLSSGHFVVSEMFNEHKISIHDPEGVCHSLWSTHPNDPKAEDFPQCHLAVDQHNRIISTCSSGSQVEIYDTNKTLLLQFDVDKPCSGLSGLCVDSHGNILVTHSNDTKEMVSIYSPDGRFISRAVEWSNSNPRGFVSSVATYMDKLSVVCEKQCVLYRYSRSKPDTGIRYLANTTIEFSKRLYNAVKLFP